MSDQDQEPEEESFDPRRALTTIVNKASFPATLRGRAEKYLLKLLMGAITHPAHQEIRDRLDEMEGRSIINRMVAEEAGRQLIRDQDYMERAKVRLLGETFRKQDNIEAIATRTLLLADERADAAIPEDEIAQEPNQDWMNAFIRAAEDASSDELRERLARTLASEARSPGSISKSTVRLVAELEQDVLECFRKYAVYAIRGAIPSEEDWSSGVALGEGLLLEDAGLLTGASGILSRNVSLAADGKLLIQSGELGILVEGEADQKLTYSAWVLSRSGKEIAALLGPFDDREALVRLAGLLKKEKLQQIRIGDVQVNPGGQTARLLNASTIWKSF